jgi:hypothetical protein
MRPERVAEPLTLRSDKACSVAACMNEWRSNPKTVAQRHSSDTSRRAGR